MSRGRGVGAESSQATSLTDTLDRLREAHDLGQDRLPEDVLERLQAMLDRAGSRRALSADHTVVGMFGATGSGKSSLVNALSGTETARVAVRRPTTSEPLALVWGVGGSGELLDWLQVTQRVELPDGAPLLPATARPDRSVPGDAGGSTGGVTHGTAAYGSSKDGAGRGPDGHAGGLPRRSGRATADAGQGRGLLRFFRRGRRDDATSSADSRPGTAPSSAVVSAPDNAHPRAVTGAPVVSPSARDGQPGLILLDLPDFDSTALAHREIVERMAGQVDVLVWVVDPQKYADAALHHGFLRGFASHETVTLVALNQVDRLSPQDADSVMASLRGILAGEGLPGASVLAVSARTGVGLDALAGEIRDLAGTRAAATRRLAADASRAAAELLPFSVEQPSQKAQEALAAQLGAAAGVPTVVDAVRASYRRDAHAVTGWPATRWLARLRADPLRRLNLRRQDVLPEHRTSSLSLNLPAQGAKVDQALRVFADTTAGDVVEPWRSSIRDAARSTAPRVTGALDTAVAGTDLETGRRAWWGVFGLLQWVAFAALVGGLVWLGVLAVLGFLQLPAIDVPRVEGFPVPTLLILGGVGAGVLLAVVAALLARAGAARRAARVRRRLLASCARVTSDVVLRPVHAELERCNAFRAAVTSALPRA
jgi:GTP-binding protein EngB required for normal cell division